MHVQLVRIVVVLHLAGISMCKSTAHLATLGFRPCTFRIQPLLLCVRLIRCPWKQSTSSIQDAWAKQGAQPAARSMDMVIKLVTEELKKDGFITDDISSGKRQYHGVARLNAGESVLLLAP